MKKIIIGCMAMFAIMFSGCTGIVRPSTAATIAQMYDTTETFYSKGKEIVIINADLLDAKTLAALNALDDVAVKVDTVKSVLVDGEDANISTLINAGLLDDLPIDDEMLERIKATKDVLEK